MFGRGGIDFLKSRKLGSREFWRMGKPGILLKMCNVGGSKGAREEYVLGGAIRMIWVIV